MPPHERLSASRARLPQDVYFVLMQPARWAQVLRDQSTDQLLLPDDYREQIVTNEDCWLVAPFLALRSRYSNVFLTDHVQPGAVCIVSGVDLGVRARSDRCFCIATRSDGHIPELADLRVVQNQAAVRTERDVFIPHWPQPGLIPRDTNRGARIEELAFKGASVNLYAPLRKPSFQQALAKLGVHFAIEERPIDGLTARWFDYEKADLVLALRNIGVEDVKVKPASKLVNAWLAGVPALLGPEPAFEELKRSELDYIVVRTPDDVVAAVAQLQADPERYQKMCDNGLERGKDFGPDRTLERWAALLEQTVPPLFRQWQRESKFLGGGLTIPRVAVRYLKHRRAMASAAAARGTGPMLLGNEA